MASRVLTQEEKLHLFHNGFVLLPQAVPKHLVHAALRRINKSLGQKSAENRSDPCPGLTSAPEITSLLYGSSAITAAESVVGRLHTITNGQIALRFPGDFAGENFEIWPSWADAWHIDGMVSEHNPYTPPGQIHHFTCLVGILLSDIDEDYCGGLGLFPGSHFVMQQHIRNHLNDILQDGDRSLPRERLQSQFSAPIQVKGKAGDVILVHYQVAHAISPNVSPFIRAIVYFRLHSIHHIPWTVRESALFNIWQDWGGMQDIVEDERAKSIIGSVTQRTVQSGLIDRGIQTSDSAIDDEERQLLETIERSKLEY